MTEEVMKQKYLELGITEEVYNYGTNSKVTSITFVWSRIKSSII